MRQAMLEEVLKRFEKQAPISVMARVALERAIDPDWVDEVFEASRQRQYPR
ncbi:IS4 family transposase, partial [Verminephrobacter aporrectodeae subsp. tuberculatae]|nr:IS4 family transposase [Verminephrobacter aporrectodeae subsp. tuberculatae]MCW8200172.1 IS4 family transposase [Verminephrobacter aporrectodeae subsp. tuberculatae]